MDNDLMARRLRPPSQPSPQSSPPAQSSPWDVPLRDDGSFASAEPQHPQNPRQDPPFAPPSPPDPAARADVPWDRPAPEEWPPEEDSGTDYSHTWLAQPAPPAPEPVLPAWPAADPLGDAAPWDRPASDQSPDPDDAMAPVVADVDATAGAWHEWTDSLAEGYAPDANSNGSGYVENAAGGAPEPMIVAAQSDQPRAGREPRPDAIGEPRPEAEDEPRPEARADAYDMPPATSHGPVTPEYPWASIFQHDTPPAPPTPWEEAEAYREAQAEVVAELTDTAEPAPAPEPEPAPAEWAASPEPAAAPEPEPVPAEWAASPGPEPVPAEWAASPEPAPEPEPAPAEWAASPEPAPAPTPVAHVADLQLPVQLSANQQNIVLRIELAIVDESRRPDAVHVVRRVGQDGDVLDLEYEPRDGGRGLAPWPEYIWDTPPEMARPRRREPSEQPQPEVAPAADWQPEFAPAADWPPEVAPAVDRQSARRPTSQPMTLDWELPAVGPAQSMPDPRAPSAPTVQPAAPYLPAPPQHELPAQPKHPPAAQLPYPPADPLYGLPAAPNPQPARYSPTGYQRAPHSPSMPTQDQYPVPAVQSAPAAGSRARPGQANAAADQANLRFLSNQPAAASAADDDAEPRDKSSSLLTAGLTVGFALLVIVLVLVFIQLMTSLLK